MMATAAAAAASPRTPISPGVPPPTFCLPIFARRRRRRHGQSHHRRARTIATVQSARREQEEQEKRAKEEEEEAEAAAAAQQQQHEGGEKAGGKWPWLSSAAAGYGTTAAMVTAVVAGRRRTFDDAESLKGQQQEAAATAAAVTSSSSVTMTATAMTMTAAAVSVTATATTTSTTTSSVSTVTTATAVTTATTTTTTTTSVATVAAAATGGQPPKAQLPPPPSQPQPQVPARAVEETQSTEKRPLVGGGLIPSESCESLASRGKEAEAQQAQQAQQPVPPPQAPAPAPAPATQQPQQQQLPQQQRRPALRSQSMGSVPRGPQQQPVAPPVDPHERFYPPSLRRSGSATGGKGSSSSSFIDELAPSLGALRGRFSTSQRRRSFAGSTSLSRRNSLEQLHVREDFAYEAQADHPALPERLVPMISHGMARLAINMKEAAMAPETWNVVLGLFAPEDAAKIKKYRFDKDRRLALGSQLLQRAVISWTFGVPYREILIARTEKGKPFFHIPPHVDTPFPNWNYNVSHHGDFVGIASEPVCLVGLDIMNAREKPRGNRASANEFFRSFHRQLSASEWGSIYQAPNDDGKLERFYRQWALKEAYIKAIGSGLSFSPRRIEITGLDHSERPNSEAPYDPSVLRIDGLERPNWRFKFSALEGGHVACVSRGPPSDAIADYRNVLRVQHLPNSPLRFGLESIQPEFDVVSLRELIPQDALAAFDASLGALREEEAGPVPDSPVLGPRAGVAAATEQP